MLEVPPGTRKSRFCRLEGWKQVHGCTTDRLRRHPVWDGKIMGGQRRQVIDIKKDANGCLRRNGSRWSREAVYLKWNKKDCAYLKCEAPPESSSEKEPTRNEENTRSRPFFRRPSHHESKYWWSSGKKGNLECRLENSRGTFHCFGLSQYQRPYALEGGLGRKPTSRHNLSPKLIFASSMLPRIEKSKVLTPLCWGLGIPRSLTGLVYETEGVQQIILEQQISLPSIQDAQFTCWLNLTFTTSSTSIGAFPPWWSSNQKSSQ